MAPQLSFIIPVFNAAPFIGECLSSLCDQTLQDIEIICVDDRSDDSSLALLREYAGKDSRITVLAQTENAFPGGARNRGLSIAGGKYVWFIDSDDYIDRNAAEFLVRKMESLKNVDVLSFCGDSFTAAGGKNTPVSDGRVVKVWPKNRKLFLPEDNRRIPPRIEGPCWSYISRRSYIGSFRFRENVTFEDADFTFDVLTSPCVFFELNYTPYHRRIRPDSLTGSGARGLNTGNLQCRVTACDAISRIIIEKKLPDSHFAVRWARSWMSFAIRLYADRPEVRTDELDETVRSLQKTNAVFSAREIFGSPGLKSLLIPEVIVSFTSFPGRIKTVDTVVESLLAQTVPCDRIILYLAECEFAETEIPEQLISLSRNNDRFEIRFCEDLKPHKKYFYAMQDYPHAVIITVDDDVVYRDSLVEDLLNSYIRNPDAVSCNYGHTIRMNGPGTFCPYQSWQNAEKLIGFPSYLSISAGVGGVLYPPGSIPQSAFDAGVIRETCLLQDDLWLKWQQLKNEIKCVVLSPGNDFDYIEDTQSRSLWNINRFENGNDSAWKRIIESDDGTTKSGRQILQILFESGSTDYDIYESLAPEGARRRRNSALDRIKTIASWPFRMVRGAVICCRSSGLKYTAGLAMVHIKSIFKKQNADQSKK